MGEEQQTKNTANRSGGRTSQSGQNPDHLEAEAVNPKVTTGTYDFKSTNLMEAVVERSNMIKALNRVESNKGAPGVDGLRTTELREHLQSNWRQIKQWLLAGAYQPSPVRRVEIPKPDGGVRLLGVPTAVDRVIQQAIGQVLDQIFDPHFSESSYGFRAKRSAHQAVSQARNYVDEGYKYVVDIDLEKFFDRVNHDVLMYHLSRKISDKRMLKVIRAYLESGVMIGGIEEPTTEGTPQGGPLSPLLSNILLDELDKELEERGHKFCRYADDCNIYVKSLKAGERVKSSVTSWLAKRLRLKVNESKSAVDHVSRRKFLGYSILTGRSPKLRPAQQSLHRLQGKIRDLFRKARGCNVEKFITQDLNPLLRGWIEYFKLSGVKEVFGDLDGWIRRKLRALFWRQWKRPKTRYQRLVQRGVSPDTAKISAGNGRGPWWNSAKAHMAIAFPNKYFDQLGLISLRHRVLRSANAG